MVPSSPTRRCARITSLEPSKLNAPPSAKYGEPNERVPVKGLPLLHVTTTLATTSPTLAVAVLIVGLVGLKEILSVGGGGAAGVSVAYNDQWFGSVFGEFENVAGKVPKLRLYQTSPTPLLISFTK